MFFLMRDTIEPMWESQDNKEGGAWTIHVTPGQIESFFTRISLFFYIMKTGVFRTFGYLNSHMLLVMIFQTSVIKMS